MHTNLRICVDNIMSTDLGQTDRQKDRQMDGQEETTYHPNSFAGDMKTTIIEIVISMVVVISIVVPKML